MKIWAIVALIVLLTTVLGGGARWAWSSGYDARDREVQQEIIEAQDAARLEEEVKWSSAVRAALEQVRIEERIVTEIREVEKEIPRVVETIVEVKPECADLGVEFIGVLNDQVRSSNGIQNPEITPSVVDGVSSSGGI